MNVNNYLESIGAKTSDKKKGKKTERKKKKRDIILGDPLYAEVTVEQLKQVPVALVTCGSLYISEIVRLFAPEYALMVFYLSAMVRCRRMMELADFFRKKEMDLHTNMRRVAFLKFFIMVFGLSHLTGCLSYFLARLAKFSGKDLNVTWVAQYKVGSASGSGSGRGTVHCSLHAFSLDRYTTTARTPYSGASSLGSICIFYFKKPRLGRDDEKHTTADEVNNEA